MAILILIFAVVVLLYAVLGHRIVTRDHFVTRIISDAAPFAVAFFGAMLLTYLFSDALDAKPRRYYHTRILWTSTISGALVLLPPRRFQPFAAGLLLVVTSLLLTADLVYYRFFGGLLPLLAVGGAGMLGDVTDSIAEVMRERDLLFVVPAVAGLVFAARCPRHPVPYALPRFPFVKTRVVLIGLGVLCIIAMTSDTYRWMQRSRSWRVLSAYHQVAWGGILNAHVRDVVRISRERAREDLSQAEIDEVTQFFQARVDARTTGPEYGALAGTNVLLVQVEGMQRFAADLTYDGALVMPFFNELRTRGVFFDRVFDLTGESLTSDCGYMVNNSLHPLKQGSVAFRRPENRFKTIAHVLKDAGYSTISAHGYRQGMWNRAILHPRFGFDESYFKEELGEQPLMGWGLSDEGLFEKLVPILEKAKKPFFAFAITLTSHHPFTYIPLDRREIPLGNRTAFSGYIHSMRYVDGALKQLFERLKAAGLDATTTVVIYGDHDSRIELDDEMILLAGEHTNLTPEVIEHVKGRGWPTDQVPVLVVPPDARVTPRVVSTIGGQVDIAPTVLHFLGLPAPASFVGRSLVATEPGHAYRVDGSAVEDDLILSGRDEAAVCYRSPLGPTEPVARCADLRVRADRETTLSERATDYDLAQIINARVKVPDTAPSGDAPPPESPASAPETLAPVAPTPAP
jgi:phosphoglycerol transferase MdoB-like AlkP superfamily enzyme